MYRLLATLGLTVFVVTGAGCLDAEAVDDGESSSATGLGAVKRGEKIFKEETFGGSTGRTCATCHDAATGTVSMDEIHRRYRPDLPPNMQPDPLFRHDAHDVQRCLVQDPTDDKFCFEFTSGLNRFLKHGTIAVEVPLAPNVWVAEDPTARSVVVFRGIPSTIDMATHETEIMHDGRVPTLEEQAVGAVAGHFGAGARVPTAKEVDDIVAYEKSLFSPRLAANGGVPPALPCDSSKPRADGALSATGWNLDGTACTVEQAQTFQTFFVDINMEGRDDRKTGICMACHAGPFLNTVSLVRGSNPFNDMFDIQAGDRFTSIFVAEINKAMNPTYGFVFENPDGTVLEFSFPDPGEGGLTGEWKHMSLFRIPTLWNVKNTAPYFHDNSAKSLEDVLDHYQQILPLLARGTLLTEEEKRAIIDYLKLL